MKKLIAVAGAAAMLLSAATPAFAGFDFRPSSGTTNKAYVFNSAVASSNTGYNTQTGKSNFLGTGDAYSEANGVVIANTTAGDCHCTPKTLSNTAYVGNSAVASSNTGYNTQTSTGGKDRGWKSTSGNVTFTGNAGSEANAWTVVNTSLSF